MGSWDDTGWGPSRGSHTFVPGSGSIILLQHSTVIRNNRAFDSLVFSSAVSAGDLQ